MSVSGKVVVITGASTGIGAQTARELSEAGARLVVTARRADLLQRLADELRTDVAVFPADIADPQTPAELLKFGTERFGRVDAIINNAGTITVAPLETIDLDEISHLIRVNYEAVVRSSYVFARAFKAQRSGAIINVTSLAAYVVTPTMGVYSGTKYAVQAFTDALRVELAGTGVKVGSIAPGSTETDMLGVLREKFGEAAMSRQMLAPEDIAKAVRFMLEQSDRANIARLAIYSATEPV